MRSNVSIIVPVFNVSAYIERCIKSVMDQTYSDIECIIVDDATPDDSILKCEQMMASYDGPIKFSILHHDHNRGLSAARNTGTNAATVEYMYYLDSDDGITPNCIETLLKPMIEDDNIEIVQGNHILDKNGKEEFYFKGTSSINVSCNYDAYLQYFKYHHIAAALWNKLMKRSFIDNHRLYCKEGIIYEDWLWIFYVLKYLEHICVCKDITYIYHVRPQSITTEKQGIALGNSFQFIIQDILNHLTPDREKFEICGYIYSFCKPYCLCLDEVPGLKETYDLYMKKAKQYNCWYVCVLLTFYKVACKTGIPMSILKKLHIIRWRLIELPDILFNRTTK